MQSVLWKTPLSAGLSKGFQKRFFKLVGNKLLYFVDEKAFEKGAAPKGELVLEPTATVSEVAKSPKPFTFSVKIAKDGAEAFLAANSEVEMKKWIVAINASIFAMMKVNKEGLLVFKKVSYWWILNDYFIQQYAKQGDTVCNAELLVKGATVGLDSKDAQGTTFTLVPKDSTSTYYFQAPTAAEAEAWLDAVGMVADIAVNKSGNLIFKKASYFWILGDSYLQQYTKQGDACRAFLPVLGGTVSKDLTDAEGLTFTLVPKDKSGTYYFQAASSAEMQSWLDAAARICSKGPAIATMDRQASAEIKSPPPGLPGPKTPLKVKVSKPAEQTAWTAVFDENYKLYYYINAATKASVWEKPAEVQQYEADLARYEAAVKEAEEEALAAEAARAESVRRAEAEKEAEAQRAREAAKAAELARAAAANKPKVVVLPKPADCKWTAMWEENYKLFYYVNQETKASVWEKPAELEQYEQDLAKHEESVKAAAEEGKQDHQPAPPSGPPPSVSGPAPPPVNHNKSRRISMVNIDEVDLTALKTMTVTELKSMAPPPPTHDASVLAVNSFATFALKSGYFETGKKALIGKKEIPEAELTCWAKTLAMPLTKAMNDSPESIKSAMQIFKNILSFMGDRKSRKPVLGHVVKLIRNALEADESFRDEVLCQLMRQTNNNPDKASLAKGFTLLELCLGCFPPSKTLSLPLSCYLQSRMGPGHSPESGQRLLACREVLEQVILNGPRKFPPSEEEVNSVLTRKHIVITVRLLDGAEHHFDVKSQTSVHDVTQHIMTSFGLDLPFFETIPCFGLSQVIYEDHLFHTETSLSPSARLLDVVISWGLLENNFEGDVEFRLMFVPRLFLYTLLKPEVLSKSALRHYYMQAVLDVVRGTYPVPMTEAFNMAALQVAVDFPSATPASIMEKLTTFVPQSILKSQQDVGNRIATLRNDSYKGKSPGECMRIYLDTAQKLPHYGAAIFKGSLHADCKFVDWDFEAGELSSNRSAVNKIETDLDWSICVSERGVLFMETDTKALKKHIQLKMITSYGTSLNPEPCFWFIHGDPRQSPTSDQCARVLVFKTTQGKSCSEMLRIYQLLPHNKPQFF